jgi:hypothetical protein
MRNSEQLVKKAIEGFKPSRTPIFDLFCNDAVITHFTGWPLDGHSDEDICMLAAANGLDATRSVFIPEHEGHESLDDMGNTVKFLRWTNWVEKYALNDEDDWVDWISSNLEKLEAIEEPDEKEIKAERVDQETFNKRIGETVYIHCTPGTAINSLLFGYHCKLDIFSYLWVDNRELVLRLLKAIEMKNRKGIEVTANRDKNPMAMIYSDIAFKEHLMFGKEMLKEMDFFGEVERLCSLLHLKGLKVIFHSDGYIMDILKDLVSAGIDGLNPIEKAAGMDVFEIRKRFPQLIIVGGVDVSELLVSGSEEDIRKETRKIIQHTGAEGRLLIGSSTEVGNDVPLKNYLAFHNEALNY